MRRDFVLPAVLAAGVAGLAAYAATATSADATTESTSDLCRPASRLMTLSAVKEASGLAASQRTPQALWTHNDSGDASLYMIGVDGSPRATVRIDGASVIDWEAVATGPCDAGTCLYIADIGDNERNRSHIVVYRVPEPTPSDTTSAAADAIEATYPDGPQDAEALFVFDGALFIVTKGEGAAVRLYRLPASQPGMRHTMQRVATLMESADKAQRVTDAAVSPDARWIALRSNDRVYFYDAAALTAGSATAPHVVDISDLDEPQGEGMAWADASTLYLAGEGSRAGTLARLTCSVPDQPQLRAPK